MLLLSRGFLLHPAQDTNHPFVQNGPAVCLPIGPLVASQLADQMSPYGGACTQVPLILLNNGPKDIHRTFIIVDCYNCSIIISFC